MSAADLLARLDRVTQCTPDRWRAICPAHESRHRMQSLTIRELPDGTLLLRCHAGCDVGQVVAAVGLELRVLFPRDHTAPADPRRLQRARHWHALREAAQTLTHEAYVAAVAADDVAQGLVLSREDVERIAAAAERIRFAEGMHMTRMLLEERALREMEQQIARTADGANVGPSAAPILRCASSIAPRDLEPLWPGVLWIAKPTLLIGDPALGKSMVTVDIAARVSRGEPWPCDSERRTPGRVMMLSAEDDPDDTIVSRLIAAGADLERITFLDGVRLTDQRGESCETTISLDDHMAALRAALLGGGYSLLTVDPISAFLGRIESHNNAEVRAILGALGRLAAELRIAVLVVSHLNKAAGTSAIYRITGSLAFVAAARSVFAIARDPEEQDRRVMLPSNRTSGRTPAATATP